MTVSNSDYHDIVDIILLHDTMHVCVLSSANRHSHISELRSDMSVSAIDALYQRRNRRLCDLQVNELPVVSRNMGQGMPEQLQSRELSSDRITSMRMCHNPDIA